MGADMHAEEKSTSSIIHIVFEKTKSVCERNIKDCNYIKDNK